MAELSGEKRAAWAHRYFQQEVLPMLTPLASGSSPSFPHLLNRRPYLLVRQNTTRCNRRPAIVQGAHSGIASDRHCRAKGRRLSVSTFLASTLINSTRRIVSRLDLD